MTFLLIKLPSNRCVSDVYSVARLGGIGMFRGIYERASVRHRFYTRVRRLSDCFLTPDFPAAVILLISL